MLNPNLPKRSLVAYLRVSTDKQDVDNQRYGIVEYAKRNNWDLSDLEFVEDVVSGKKSWRDREIGKIIKTARSGDILLVSEISRLARSTLQVLEILQKAAEIGLAVHVVKNNMIMDGSLHSRITATILGLAAEIEREFISARTTEALAKRKAEGKHIGRPRGCKNLSKKLDKHEALIRDLLHKGVNKNAIIKIVDCTHETLYSWMRSHGLERYIAPKPQKLANKTEAPAVEPPRPPKKAAEVKPVSKPPTVQPKVKAAPKRAKKPPKDNDDLTLDDDAPNQDQDSYSNKKVSQTLVEAVFNFIAPKKRKPGRPKKKL